MLKIGFPLIPPIALLFFDINEPGTKTQLSYKQKKREDSFNTKIALKTDIREDLKFITFMETKSYFKNINQNALLKINKTYKMICQ